MASRKKTSGGHRAKPSYNYEAKTDNQQEYLDAIDNNTITIGVGPAGTGKSLGAVAKALDYLYTKNERGGCKQIILTRPVVEVGEHLGSLPGSIEDKISPYAYPLYDNMAQLITPTEINKLVEADKLKFLPIAYTRGTNFRNAFIVVDEAQNSRPAQMLCLLTRMDDQSKMVVTGDRKQSDVRGVNGLEDALLRLRGIKGIATVHFNVGDIQRNKLIKDIIAAYDREDLQIEKKH